MSTGWFLEHKGRSVASHVDGMVLSAAGYSRASELQAPTILPVQILPGVEVPQSYDPSCPQSYDPSEVPCRRVLGLHR